MEDEKKDKLEFEYQRMDAIQRMQEEVSNLNKSLTKCIQIVGESIGNDKVKAELEQMKEDSQNKYIRAINDLDYNLDECKNTIDAIKETIKKEEENLQRESKEE